MIKAADFLKSSEPPQERLFAIVGEESFLRDQVVERVLSALPPDVEVQSWQGPATAAEKGFELRDLLDDLRTASLFGSERVIHLKEADVVAKENAAALARFISEGEVVHRFILEAPKLLARGAKALPKTGVLPAIEAAGGIVVSCDPLYDTPFMGRGPAHASALSRWVQDQAVRHGKRIAIEDAYSLHRLVGTGLRELDAELRKLAIYVKDRKTITAEDIEAATGAGRLAAVFEFAETVARRDGPNALEQSSVLFERGLLDFSGRHVKEAASVALTMLSAVTMRLRKVARVRELMAGGSSFDEAARKVKHPPMFDDRLRVQAEAWKRPEDVQRAVEGLAELERSVKSGGPPQVQVDTFLVEMTRRDGERQRTGSRP